MPQIFVVILLVVDLVTLILRQDGSSLRGTVCQTMFTSFGWVNLITLLIQMTVTIICIV